MFLFYVLSIYYQGWRSFENVIKTIKRFMCFFIFLNYFCLGGISCHVWLFSNKLVFGGSGVIKKKCSCKEAIRTPLYSQILQIEICRNICQVLSKVFLLTIFIRYCLSLNSGRFPREVQKEEIQQQRQERSRPRENETLNIMLWENIDIQVYMHI